MPKVLKSFGTLQWDEASATGPITLKCNAEGWNSALLQASGRGGFVMKVVAVRGMCILAGIAPAYADMSGEAFRKVGHHIFAQNLTWFGEGGIENHTLVGLLQERLAPSQELHLRYVPKPQPELAVSLDGKSFTRVPAELKHAKYVPCVVLYNSDASVQIEELGASQHAASEGRKLMQDCLWQDRLFTDCTVTCGSSEFHCHRAVLANASAVWRTSLESSFREGREAKLRIENADPCAVEAVLRYVYTREFELDYAAAALGLAYRYEMSSLVALCAQQVLEGVTVENVARLASTMNICLEHEEVAKVWPEFLKIVGQDRSLMDAAMRQVKVRNY